MEETTTSCQICSKEITKEVVLYSLSNDSIPQSKLFTVDVKPDLNIDDNPPACNKCQLKIDEEHLTFVQNENVLKTEYLPRSLPTNFSTLVNDENYLEKNKDEFVEVAIKNENEEIDTNEYVLFNTDIEISKSSDILYYCYHCNYAISDKEKLTDHLLKCNLCRYISFDNSSLENHKKSHFKIIPEENVIECVDVFTNKKFFNSHCHFNKSINLCKQFEDYRSRNKITLCRDTGIQTQENLKKHKFKHLGEKPFTCEKCDFRCRKKSHLIRHDRTHTQEKPFKCNFCNYCTNRKDNLKAHVYIHSEEKPFSCDKCHFSCRNKSGLKKHNRTHTQEKPFQCNFCDYRSSQKIHLKTHMYKHSGEKPFSCDKCDFSCRKKYGLIQHYRTHTQEKPFKCSFCDYCSSQKVLLKTHMYKHSEEKPFSCDKCDYQCRNKSGLVWHNRTHTQEKLFMCNFCDYCSNSKGNLKRHMQKH